MKIAQIVLTLCLLTLFAMTSFAAEIKESDLAGSWYPRLKVELQGMLQGYLDAANPPKIDGDILAIISPHAGYQFSAPVAAYGYKAAQNKPIKTVIIVGFSHRRSFDGISVYDRGAWLTPLGTVDIDEALAKEIISKDPCIRFEPNLFKEENSIEMQIPFVQMAFKDARIVPIAFGFQDYKDGQILADALSAVIKDRNDILIVASTDMSHYHPYEKANSMDKFTMDILGKMDAGELYEKVNSLTCELCGIMPVVTVMLTAKNLGFDKIEMLKYANSGDTFGDKSKVVGYLSAVVYKKENKEDGRMLNDKQRKRLLQIARESITSAVKYGKKKQFNEKDPVLNESRGAFVTLHEHGALRGCIGNMVGQGPLYKTVADMAIEAATGDPRFPTMNSQEIDAVDIEISVLSPLKKVSDPDQIKIPGDGVIVKKGFKSGVYLPQVATETGWNKEEFMTSLCAQKAGISPDAWKNPATEIYTFTAEVFGEKE